MYNAYVITLVLIILISIFGLDMKEPYPHYTIKLFSEPYVRFFCYLSIYLLAIYSPILGIVSSIGILLLHIDYINLVIT